MKPTVNKSDVFELNNKKLEEFIKAFKGNIPQAKVGILGEKNKRKEGAADTNASIGLKHEFGDPSENLPARSFLRAPIADNLQKFLESAGAFDEDSLKKIVDEGSLKSWIVKFGLIGEQIVAEAFASGGFGKWKPSVMANKKNHQTLVETQQLRESITSEVKE